MKYQEGSPGDYMFRLNQRHKPVTSADWRKVARLVLDSVGKRDPSPMFQALLDAEDELREAVRVD